MTASTRQVTWGQALRVELVEVDGGLKAATDVIKRELGELIGTRNTFAKLLRVDDPAELGEADQWRAWLLLTAIGLEPADWGVAATAVPKYVDAAALAENIVVHRRGLEPRTRWLSHDISNYVLGGPLRRESKPFVIPPRAFPESPARDSYAEKSSAA